MSRVDVPGYDNYLDMLTEASFYAGSQLSYGSWAVSSYAQSSHSLKARLISLSNR